MASDHIRLVGSDAQRGGPTTSNPEGKTMGELIQVGRDELSEVEAPLAETFNRGDSENSLGVGHESID
jgi:hypothetical protein